MKRFSKQVKRFITQFQAMPTLQGISRDPDDARVVADEQRPADGEAGSQNGIDVRLLPTIDAQWYMHPWGEGSARASSFFDLKARNGAASKT